jgi:hypothetical protein
VGSYYWTATYSGDGNYLGAPSACADAKELVTINPATPAVTTVAQPSTSGTVGLALSVGDKATVTGNGGVTPTGTVVFTLFASNCSTVALGPSAAQPLSGSAGVATASYSTSWTPPAAGKYYWVASYTSGDGNYNNNTSSCPDTNELVTINPATPAVTTVAQPNTSGTVGLALTVGDKVTVTGNDGVTPTGTVVFTLFASDCSTVALGPSAAQSLTGSAGVATATYTTTWSTPQATGKYYWVASYTSGDSNYKNNISTCPDPNELVTINSATPPVTTQASPQSGTVGVALTVSDKATVTGNDGVTPTGTVTFTLWTNNTCKTVALGPSAAQPLSGSAGVATATYSTSWTPPAVGSYYWTAIYSGDNNYMGATSTCADPKELVTVTGLTALIAPTGTTCDQFINGTALALPPPGVSYRVTNTNTINGINPGVFFYYTSLTAPASSFSIDILQSNTSTNSFPDFPALNGQVILYLVTGTPPNATCTKVVANIAGAPADFTISVTGASPGATYVVGVKYNPSALRGNNPPNPANLTYSYSTKLNGALIVSSQQSVPFVKS